jgi:rhodanese-related sulfurtransferase
MQRGEKFKAIVADTKQRIQEITFDELQQLKQEGQAFHIIDVRESSEWEKEAIPEAIHMSKGVIERDIEHHFPDQDTKIILYCGGGSRSALAAENLMRMGYTNVFSLVGGYRGWKSKQV